MHCVAMCAMANARMETKLRVLANVHLRAAVCANKRAACVSARAAVHMCMHAEHEAA